MPIAAEQSLNQWQDHRRRLRRWFWVYLIVGLVGAFVFVCSFHTRDPYVFAILVAIPLISLRQAWRMDRQIVECDKHIRMPIIDEIKEKS